MAIIEKIEFSELALYEILRNPVLFAEFIYNIDNTGYDKEFELTLYQKEFMLDFSSYVSLCCGRAVGKTVSLSFLILWALVFKVFPDDYIVYFVPGKAQLDPVWTNLIRILRSNSFLKHFIQTNAGVNASEFRITLLNNSVLLCRIAGQSGTGINVIGLHTPFSIVDESAYFPWNVFMEMQPIVNTFTSGYKVFVSGVPKGTREHDVCYHCDQENSNYSKHRISALENPRFSEKDQQFAEEQYGGKDSDDYIHNVLGLHGKPIFALFDRSIMEIQNYPVYRLVIDGLQTGENLLDIYNKLSLLPGLPDKSSKCVVGIDLGFTEPTAIYILNLTNLGQLKFHAKIQLTKVSYPIQEKFIDILDTKFNPIIIGMDKGSAGISVLQHLMDDVAYMHKDYRKRLIPVDFSASIVLGTDSEGMEIKSKTKPFATSILQDYANNHKIVFSTTDLETVTELERMTYTKTVNGEIVYRTLTPRGGKKGEDHFTSALLCAGLAYYMNNEFILTQMTKKKLFRSTWFIGM